MDSIVSANKDGAPKPPKKEYRKQPDAAIVGSFMPNGLFESLDAAAPEEGQKHIFFDEVLKEYIRAWSSGKVPRVYIGASKDAGSQRSFYIHNKTIAALRTIAVDDGVSLSHVVRTAVCWYLYKHLGKKDKWGTDIVFGPRTKIRVNW